MAASIAFISPFLFLKKLSEEIKDIYIKKKSIFLKTLSHENRSTGKLQNQFIEAADEIFKECEETINKKINAQEPFIKKEFLDSIRKQLGFNNALENKPEQAVIPSTSNSIELPSLVDFCGQQSSQPLLKLSGIKKQLKKLLEEKYPNKKVQALLNQFKNVLEKEYPNTQIEALLNQFKNVLKKEFPNTQIEALLNQFKNVLEKEFPHTQIEPLLNQFERVTEEASIADEGDPEDFLKKVKEKVWEKFKQTRTQAKHKLDNEENVLVEIETPLFNKDLYHSDNTKLTLALDELQKLEANILNQVELLSERFSSTLSSDQEIAEIEEIIKNFPDLLKIKENAVSATFEEAQEILNSISVTGNKTFITIVNNWLKAFTSSDKKDLTLFFEAFVKAYPLKQNKKEENLPPKISNNPNILFKSCAREAANNNNNNDPFFIPAAHAWFCI